jgi:hypothetical protein
LTRFTLCDFILGTMSHDRFIERLGDSLVVAKSLGIPVNRVSNWKRRGVPWHWRHKVAQMAKEQDIALPAGFLTPEVAAE